MGSSQDEDPRSADPARDAWKSRSQNPKLDGKLRPALAFSIRYRSKFLPGPAGNSFPPLPRIFDSNFKIGANGAVSGGFGDWHRPCSLTPPEP